MDTFLLFSLSCTRTLPQKGPHIQKIPLYQSHNKSISLSNARHRRHGLSYNEFLIHLSFFLRQIFRYTIRPLPFYSIVLLYSIISSKFSISYSNIGPKTESAEITLISADSAQIVCYIPMFSTLKPITPYYTSKLQPTPSPVRSA